MDTNQIFDMLMQQEVENIKAQAVGEFVDQCMPNESEVAKSLTTNLLLQSMPAWTPEYNMALLMGRMYGLF